MCIRDSDEAVDFVMTFEEVSSIFDAFEVNLEIVQPVSYTHLDVYKRQL